MEKELDPKKPADAIQILDTICSQYNGNRQEHFAIQTAVNTIKELIEIIKEKKDKCQ